MLDRQAWLEARRNGIGGTDGAAILGLSRYRSAVDVWEDKLGLVPDRPATAAMMWGRRLEDAIAQAFATETGRAVRRVGGIRKAKHVTGFPMIGSIDRMTYDRPMTGRGVVQRQADPRGLEVKKVRSADVLGDPEGPPELRIPPDWYVQVQHYAEVIEVDFFDVAVLVGGTDFRTIEIPRDRDFGRDLVAEEERFWTTYVVPRVQPPVGPDDLAFLGRKYPRDEPGSELVATSELALVIDAYLDAVEAVERAEGLRDGYRARIEDAMGTHSKLVSGSASVSWKAHERTSTAWREVAGGLRSAVERVLSFPDPRVQEILEAALSDGFGTTDLDDVERLFQTTTAVRPFRAERKDRE